MTFSHCHRPVCFNNNNPYICRKLPYTNLVEELQTLQYQNVEEYGNSHVTARDHGHELAATVLRMRMNMVISDVTHMF